MDNLEMVEALRAAMAEWDALTPEQQDAELESATDKADAIVRIMEWNTGDAFADTISSDTAYVR